LRGARIKHQAHRNVPSETAKNSEWMFRLRINYSMIA
jgi:hypothetical protein